MMMPANFTAVNSEVVYGGASLLDTLGDMAAPVWGASNVRTFNTNILTILSNTFTTDLVGATLGTMFSGYWGNEDQAPVDSNGNTAAYKLFDKESGSFSGLYYNGDEKMNFLNSTMQTIGLLASVYTLGTTNAKNLISNKIIFADGSIA